MVDENLFRLMQIYDCIEKIEYLTRLLDSQDHFEKNWIAQDAILQNLEIIGEASVNISEDLKQNYPDVSWKEIKGMRNFIVHQYFGVELSEVWSTVLNDIPLLKKQIQEIIESINSNNSVSFS